MLATDSKFKNVTYCVVKQNMNVDQVQLPSRKNPLWYGWQESRGLEGIRPGLAEGQSRNNGTHSHLSSRLCLPACGLAWSQ